MFLSRVYVSWPRSKNVYSLHQALWELFPDAPDAARDFLYRVEQESTGQGAILLMQSTREPVNTADSVDIQATRAYNLNPKEGQRIRFLLKANPVKTIKDEKGRKNGKGEVKSCRVPLITEDDQLQWLKRKFDDTLLLEEVNVSPGMPMYFKKRTHAGKIVPVRFEGIATVRNAEAFSVQLSQGVGPAKALGCGMLSIAPLG